MNTQSFIQKLERIVKLLKEQNMLLKKVFNSRDAALYLGITLDHLYHLTGKSIVPCYKVNGHRLFFSHEELEKWLLSNKKTVNSKAHKPSPPLDLQKEKG